MTLFIKTGGYAFLIRSGLMFSMSLRKEFQLLQILNNYHFIAFFDVFISGINNQNLTLQTYHKSNYTGLLLNCKSFTSFPYMISVIKCLIDRSFEINLSAPFTV